MINFDNENDTVVDQEVVKKLKGWGNYIQAKLGFRNHWYPVGFSEDLEQAQANSIRRRKTINQPH